MSPTRPARVLTRQQVREVDRRAVEEYGIPGIVLMENAARGLVDHALRMLAEAEVRCGDRGWSRDREVLVLCGAGNNGGDGLAAARHLHNAGRSVTVALLQADEKYRGDARTNLRICRRMALPLRDVWADPVGGLRQLPRFELVLDGLLGTGLSGAVRPAMAEVIGWVNGLGETSVLAIDLPSGLDCDTGEPLGVAVRADLTVTFVGLKRGMLAGAARAWCGRIEVAGIGAPRELVEQVGEAPPA